MKDDASSAAGSGRATRTLAHGESGARTRITRAVPSGAAMLWQGSGAGAVAEAAAPTKAATKPVVLEALEADQMFTTTAES